MYGNISITELFSRLHFLENHTRCQSDELAKKQQKIDEQTEEIKVLKEELNRLTEFLKLAGKKIYGSSTERMSEDYGQLSFYEDDEEQTVSYRSHPSRDIRNLEKYVSPTGEVYYLDADGEICTPDLAQVD